MKTFQQFQQDLKEFAPALAPLAPYVLPAAAAALGAAGMYLAKKQGEGRRSQPVDYGQGGETKARTPNVQRPSAKLTAAETQKRLAQQERKEEARRRAEEKAKEKIDNLIGSDEERAAAARARSNPEAQRSAALKRTVSQRMSQAADKLGLDK